MCDVVVFSAIDIPLLAVDWYHGLRSRLVARCNSNCCLLFPSSVDEFWDVVSYLYDVNGTLIISDDFVAYVEEYNIDMKDFLTAIWSTYSPHTAITISL
jgi:hypothetical protein